MTTYNGTSFGSSPGITSTTTISTDAASFLSTSTTNVARGIYTGSNTSDGILTYCNSTVHAACSAINSSGAGGYGVYASTTSGYGVYGIANASSGVAVYARNGSTGGLTTALYADASGAGSGSKGIYTIGDAYGLYTDVNKTSGNGVYVQATNVNWPVAVKGNVNGTGSNGYGIHGLAPTGSGNYAGFFSGDVYITGNLSKGTGSFVIDHPLDPENKYLTHSFVESPDMKNIYDGVVAADTVGEAVVQLPSYFDSLNTDLRYQLTPLGSAAPTLHVKEEMNDGKFTIAGANPGQRVSWQVTGVRQDALAKARPIVVERDKEDDYKSFYLHPEAYGQPASKGIEAQREEMRKQAAL
jgi:hypothetical protein